MISVRMFLKCHKIQVVIWKVTVSLAVQYYQERYWLPYAYLQMHT